MSKRWYAVQTKSSQEKLAQQELQKQSFEIFYPTYQEVLVNKRLKTKQKTVKPLFPAYIFVRFDASLGKWKCINNTRGCVGLVGCGEDYVCPVPEGCVEELIGMQDEYGHIPLKQSAACVLEFSEGMELGIKGENYAGLVGTYCSHTDTRVTILLALLSRKIRVSLPITAVYASNSVKGDGGSVEKIKKNPK